MSLVIKQLKTQSGFTLVELITVMVILGVLAATALPRFFNRSSFDSRGLYDTAISTLRYAQKVAVAQRRFVCVAYTANSITLSIGATAACGTNLVDLNGQTPYTVSAPNGVTLSGGSNFNFDALGRASLAQSVTVSGYNVPITVEAETGYVH